MKTHDPISTHPMLKSICEQTISRHYRTKSHAPWPEATIRITSLEIQSYTVADCLRIFYEDSRKEQAEAVSHEEKQLAYWKEQLDTLRTTGNVFEEITETACIRNIRLAESRLEVLRNISPAEHTIGRDINMDMVVSLYATCSYQAFLPSKQMFRAGTDTFILSPDGQTVFSQLTQKIG